jgi:hypothetical protein
VDDRGSQSGYIGRHGIPSRIIIKSVNPNFDTAVKELKEGFLGMHYAVGDVVVRNDDGSITCTPNPNISLEERMERARTYQLEQQSRWEALAKVPE